MKSAEIRKRVFISFAIADIQYRNFLVSQARDHRTPFDFIDMSVKVPWSNKIWQERCLTKIRRCHGAIALLSTNTYHSSGARWEIKCIRQEGIPIVGMHISRTERGAIPPELQGKRTIIWTWKNIEKFINSL